MELQYDPAGRTLLKTTGVIMLLFGVLGFLIYAVGLAAVIGVTYVTSGILSGSDDLIGMGLLLAAAVAELIAGILGLRAAKKPARAGKSLLVWGVLTLLLTLAGMGHIALRTTNAPLWELVLGLILGVVTPVVYLVAAARILKGPVYEDEESEQTPEPEDPEL
jgi:hypothetical protein